MFQFRNKIIVQLSGGLGNQMFQFAFAKYLSIKLNIKLEIDDTYFGLYPEIKSVTKRKYELELFKKLIDKRISVNIFFRSLPISKITYHLFQLFLKLKYKPLTIDDGTNIEEFVKRVDLSNKVILCKGYFQKNTYVEDAKNELLKSFDIMLDSENMLLIEQMRVTESVSIHVRRTDYLWDDNTKLGDVCDLNYYKKAVEYIGKTISNPTYFVFSDDIEWCKKNIYISNAKKINYISHNTGDDSYKDMILMSNCKHNIIANSTFSWWGAWLNKNVDKLVIGPQKWQNNAIQVSQHLMLNEWIKI